MSMMGGVVARLRAVMGLDTREFDAGIQGAKRNAKSFQSVISGVGSALGVAFSVGGVLALGKALVGWAGAIGDAAENVGILTSEMYALNESFAKNGLGIEDLQKMFAKVESDVFAAAYGTRELNKVYATLGFTLKELAAMSPEERFIAVSKAALESANATGALAEVYGTKLGPKAVGALRDVIAGHTDLNEAVAGTIDKMDALEERVNKFWNQAKGYAVKYITWWVGINDKIMAAPAALITGIATGKNPIDVYKKYFIAEKAESDKRLANKKAELARQAADLKAAAEKSGTNADGTEKPSNEAMSTWEKWKKSNDDVWRKKVAVWDRQKAERARIRDQIADQEKRHEERLISIQQNATGRGVNPDNMARVGLFAGGERAGLAALDRQVNVQIESAKAVRENTVAVKELKDQLALVGKTGGSAD